ncbi:hypothetical protein NKR23_g7087 [Pleurostoma richardsiae]|uniref:Uncharacterized protein n=1 Tax=Pleurostoma richardsiae TaxID=41990 RepID=A0AA38RP57_9PEZI|nr:hypothetical protein NKR23_g7087 [Pleurostoma richardsiae]
MAERPWWNALGARRRTSSDESKNSGPEPQPRRAQKNVKNNWDEVSRFSNLIKNDIPVRSPKDIWIAPTPTQIIETLSTTIMANGVFEPIPKQLNSCVLELIAQHRNHIWDIKGMREQLEEAKESHQADIRHFKKAACEWKKREAAYKAEIKRLELIVTETTEGVRAVILARNNSVVDRDSSSKWEENIENSFDKNSEGTDGCEDVATHIDGSKDNTKGNSAKTPVLENTSAHLTIGSLPRLADHDADVRLSKELSGQQSARGRGVKGIVYKRVHLRPGLYGNEQDSNAQPSPSSNSSFSSSKDGLPSTGQTAASARRPPSSKTSTSSPDSSVSLIAKGILEERVKKTLDRAGVSDLIDFNELSDLSTHFERLTEGKRCQNQDNTKAKAKGSSKADAKAALLEELKHRKMPDSAIESDDDDSFVDTPPKQQRRHQRQFSFVPGDEARAFPASHNQLPSNHGTTAAKKTLTPTKDVTTLRRSNVTATHNGKEPRRPRTPEKGARAEPVVTTTTATSYKVPAVIGEDLRAQSPASKVARQALAAHTPLKKLANDRDSATPVGKEGSAPKAARVSDGTGPNQQRTGTRAPASSSSTEVSVTAASARGSTATANNIKGMTAPSVTDSSSSTTAQPTRTPSGNAQIAAARALASGGAH